MPLTRHDPEAFFTPENFYVSTHMPLTRHDQNNRLFFSPRPEFLLTCLLRGMTRQMADCWWFQVFLLTCLLRGMTVHHTIAHRRGVEFLLTCLLRGMTIFLSSRSTLLAVSTHMPLTRHDVDFPVLDLVL